MLYMGAPARPVFRSSPSSAAAAGPKDANARLMHATWPLVQPLIAFGIATLATYATLCVSLAIAAARGAGPQVRCVAPLLMTVCTCLSDLLGLCWDVCLGAPILVM